MMADHTHIRGLHHVTAIASGAQANVDFYTRVLGLRLVKAPSTLTRRTPIISITAIAPAAPEVC